VSSAFVDELQRVTEEEAVGGASWSRGLARFRRNSVSLGGAVLVALLVTMALAAPLIARVVGHGPNELFSSEVDSFGLPLGPSRHFVLGVDQEGRDLLVRSVYGLRTSLLVSLDATAIATTIGVVAGLVAGYSGGWLDNLTSRVADVFLALPIVLVAISISSVCSVNAKGCAGGLIHPGIGLVILILVMPSWPYLARIVRGQTLSLREQEFVATARALGASHRQVMFREILPNLWSQIIVFAALLIPTNIIFEATLSYLGVGIPPTTPSLGGILSDATNGSLFRYAWWMMVFPGTIVILTAHGFFIVGEGLRDAFHSSSE
jgi:ABC-type dipeptide/oligopeptide/nickel transport system permease subunit